MSPSMLAELMSIPAMAIYHAGVEALLLNPPAWPPRRFAKFLRGHAKLEGTSPEITHRCLLKAQEVFPTKAGAQALRGFERDMALENAQPVQAAESSSPKSRARRTGPSLH